MGVLTGMDSPPGRSAPHLVADFLELTCVATIDGEWGVADLIALRKAKDNDGSTVRDASDRELLLGEDDDADADVAVAAALDLPMVDAEPQGDGDADDAEANASPGPAAGDDLRAVEGSEIADVLAYRASRFGDQWPFELVDADSLRLRDPLKPLHRAYLFLLLASCLAHLDKANSSLVTTAFERLAPSTLSGHLGSRAEVHLFGTSTGSAGRYSGSLWDKLQQLASDLRVKLLVDQEDVATNFGGDNGLDAVAWLPTGDGATTLVSVFAQCACGKDWRKKQGEASEMHWAPVLALRSPIVNMTLIPYSFRRPDGGWDDDYHVDKGVLLDRERILSAIETGGSTDLEALVPPIVDEVIRQGTD